jgi:hypothetical protein
MAAPLPIPSLLLLVALHCLCQVVTYCFCDIWFWLIREKLAYGHGFA